MAKDLAVAPVSVNIISKLDCAEAAEMLRRTEAGERPFTHQLYHGQQVELESG